MSPAAWTDSPPDAGAAPTWDEAYVRVESYLRAHRVHPRIRLVRLTMRILHQAQQDIQPGESPVGAAMRVTDAMIEAWLKRILQHDEAAGARAQLRGRLALVMADVPERWPEEFLSEEDPPKDLQEAVRAAYLEAGPEVRFSNMAPRPINLGPIANLAGDTWEALLRWPLLRSVLAVSLGLGLAVIGWLLIR